MKTKVNIEGKIITKEIERLEAISKSMQNALLKYNANLNEGLAAVGITYEFLADMFYGEVHTVEDLISVNAGLKDFINNINKVTNLKSMQVTERLYNAKRVEPIGNTGKKEETE